MFINVSRTLIGCECIVSADGCECIVSADWLCRNVQLEDEGMFVCRATNEGGYNEEVLWLIVHSTSAVI